MKVTHKRCQCRDCGEYFNSVGAFDAHRVFENPKVRDWTKRKCDTSGMAKNQAGFWITARIPFLAKTTRVETVK